MVAKLFFLFTIVPVVEVFLLIQTGRAIGALPTVALLLLMAFGGAWLARTQGFFILRRIQDELAHGRLPAEELLDGALVLTGGILLLTPGFFTDLLGFVLLFPPSRAWTKRYMRARLERSLRSGTIVIRGPWR